MITTLFMLLYGDYANLHRRVLEPLAQQPTEQIGVRLWLNTVCCETLQWLLDNAPSEWVIYVSDENVPKYKVMRQLFNEQRRPITTPWVTWFDDDTVINEHDWLSKTVSFTEAHPDVTIFGKECSKPHLSGVEAWIRKATWYRKRSFQRGRSKRQRRIKFIQGSYWWLRTAALRAVDWPDPRLNHNGGDTALSEAMWQHNFDQTAYTYGVAVDCVDRRGLTEKPAGSKESAYASDNSRPAMVGAMPEYKRLIAASGRPGRAHTARLLVLSPDGALIAAPTAAELQKAKKATGHVRSIGVTHQSKPKPHKPPRPARKRPRPRLLPAPPVPPPAGKKKNKTLKQLLKERRVR